MRIISFFLFYLGIITTLKILDRESIISDTITVRATDISSSPTLSQITIRVLVEDVNDVTPSFLTSSDVSLLCVVEERKEKGLFYHIFVLVQVYFYWLIFI